MDQLLFGPWPLFAVAKPWQVLAAALVFAQLLILVLHRWWGKTGTSSAGDGGDLGDWDLGDGDGAGCGD